DEDLCAWVRKMVRLFGFEVVVIDDLSAVMRTDDGTFDSLRIMREMKRLSLETGISVLVLADSYPRPRHDISEADLRRSRVLCHVADSVFGIGSGQHGRLKLVQFRSQGTEVKWGSLNSIGCAIARDSRGVLGFAFDERFAPKLDPVRCMFICRANKLRGEGKTFREIAGEMSIPVSQASRLFHAWTPSVHKVVHGPDSPLDRYGHDASEVDDDEYDDEYDDEFDESDDDEYADEEYESPLEAAPAAVDMDENRPQIRLIDPPGIPFAAALGRRFILDLERRTDAYGHEIFVESASPPTGKPVIWYKQNRQRNFTRYERKLTGILTQNLGMSGFVP
ncbi:MAG TPA: hypothetical protein VHQ01_06825, partial [Pyrinomonadaceae bacterium]|nr:hypothetical protein [Pyrinomonadaceae bacterium]